jgi:hypothetical protein
MQQGETGRAFGRHVVDHGTAGGASSAHCQSAGPTAAGRRPAGAAHQAGAAGGDHACSRSGTASAPAPAARSRPAAVPAARPAAVGTAAPPLAAGAADVAIGAARPWAGNRQLIVGICTNRLTSSWVPSLCATLLPSPDCGCARPPDPAPIPPGRRRDNPAH